MNQNNKNYQKQDNPEITDASQLKDVMRQCDMCSAHVQPTLHEREPFVCMNCRMARVRQARPAAV
jgi:hypothetical protein